MHGIEAIITGWTAWLAHFSRVVRDPAPSGHDACCRVGLDLGADCPHGWPWRQRRDGLPLAMDPQRRGAIPCRAGERRSAAPPVAQARRGAARCDRRATGRSFADRTRDGAVHGVEIAGNWNAVAAEAIVAPSRWTGLVVDHGRRQSAVHAGAARRRGSGRVLRRRLRATNFGCMKTRLALTKPWAASAPRDAHVCGWPPLCAGRHRHSQLSRRGDRRAQLVARHQARRAELTPEWGFCSSPLVVDGKVIVFAGGGIPSWCG